MIYDFSKIICRIYPISIYIKMRDYNIKETMEESDVEMATQPPVTEFDDLPF